MQSRKIGRFQFQISLAGNASLGRTLDVAAETVTMTHILSIGNRLQAAQLFIRLLRVFAGGKHRAVPPGNICPPQRRDRHQSGVANSSKFITVLLQH